MWYQSVGPAPHPAWTTPGLQLSGWQTSCGWAAPRTSCRFAPFRIMFWCDSLVWLFVPVMDFMVMGVPGRVGWLQPLQPLDLTTVLHPWRSLFAPAAAGWLFLCWPTSACVGVRVTVWSKGLLLTQQLPHAFVSPFHVSVAESYQEVHHAGNNMCNTAFDSIREEFEFQSKINSWPWLWISKSRFCNYSFLN